MRPAAPRMAAFAALVAGVVLAVAPPPTPPSADAQELPLLDPVVPEPRAVVALDRIDATVPSGTSVTWSLLVEQTDGQPWERVEVVAELHAALGSRSALRAALDGGQVPRRLRRTVTEVGALEPGALVRVSGDVPLTGAALEGTDTAVHPLRLRVLDDGEELGRIDTAFVRVGTAPSATLATTLVWELTAPPARDPEGDVATLLDPLTRDGGRLDTLLRGLEGLLPDPPPLDADGSSGAPAEGAAPAAPGPPPEVAPFARAVAVAVPPHLVEDLARRAADAVTRADDAADPAALRAATLLERLRVVVGTLPAGPLSTPYADADVARLLASGPTLQALAPRALLESDERTAALLGRLTGPAALPGTPLTDAMLDLLPARTVVVPYAAIEGPDLALDIPLEEPVRTLRSPTGRRVTALVGDPFLTDALGASTRTRPGDPVRAAQEVLVRTAMIHLEAPSREGRSLAILPPPAFDPDPRFVDELLTRLAAAPWLAPTGPEATVAATTSRIPTRLAEVDVAPLPAPVRDALVATSADLELLVDTVDLSAGGGDGAIPVGARTLREAADELLRATSRSLRAPAAAVGLLDGVRAGVADTLGEIVVTIDDVTLTDREGTVPFTLSHDGAVPLRTRVTLSGPAALTWTDGRVREVTFAAVDERALEVPVRTGATGRFAVTVEVTDPSGTRVLAREVAGVRATALAGPALVAIGAVVLVLVVIGTVRQRRRGLAWPPATRAAALEQDAGTR